MSTEKKVKMVAVKSSAIKAVGYDDEAGELHVQFQGGASWVYEDVSLDEFNELLHADSVGKYFHREIRGEYEGRPLGAVEEE